MWYVTIAVVFSSSNIFSHRVVKVILVLLVAGHSRFCAFCILCLDDMLAVAAILSYPFQCEQKNPAPCQRGKHLGRANFPEIYRFIFFLPIRGFVYVFLVICMTMIYRNLVYIDSRSSSLRSRTMDRSSQSLSNNIVINNNNKTSPNVPSTPASSTSPVTTAASTTRAAERSTLNRLTRQFATQALLYCCAFFITWLFPNIGLIVGLVQNGPIPYPILLLSDLFTPLQGFWNAFIYLRPRYLRYRRRQYENEQRQQLEQEQAETRRMARVAHLLAQQGLALVQALSVQNENDDGGAEVDDDDVDEEDGDYLIVLSHAEEKRMMSSHPVEESTATTPRLFNETSSPALLGQQ
jgi:hypothetical protein